MMTFRAFTLILTLAAALAAAPKPMPEISGQRLSDKEDVLLTDLADGRPYLALVAFSKGAGETMRPLMQAIRADHSPTELRVFNIPALSKVPGLFRGMVRGSLRGDIPERAHGDVVMIFDEEVEDGMRAALGAQNDELVYAVAVNGAGEIIAMAATEGGAAAYPKVRPLIEKLGAAP